MRDRLGAGRGSVSHGPGGHRAHDLQDPNVSQATATMTWQEETRTSVRVAATARDDSREQGKDGGPPAESEGFGLGLGG
jgi:hypothetical protein